VGRAKFSFLGVKLEAREAGRQEERKEIKTEAEEAEFEMEVQFHLFRPTYNIE
jgi:hypothetical protein